MAQEFTTARKRFQPVHYLTRISVGNLEGLLSNDIEEDYNTIFSEGENRLAADLNEVKAAVDQIYQVNESLYQECEVICDLYAEMRNRLQRQYGAMRSTNAWMKFREVTGQFGLLPTANQATPFRVFLNAEFPGAASFSLTHYMTTNRIAFEWRASSILRSADREVAGDSFLQDTYRLYQDRPQNWLMSAHNDGDATVTSNILDFEQQIGPRGSQFNGVDLYHHDASTDKWAPGNANEDDHETVDAQLHLGCALTGFLTLKPGGSFVAAQFTCFNTLTWNLILIYASLFDEFYLSKPLTSRTRNSEMYLVGKGFKGLPDATRALLFSRLRSFDIRPLIKREAFVVGGELFEPLRAIHQFTEQIYRQQIDVIKETMYFFKHYNQNFDRLRRELRDVSERRIEQWLQVYPILPMANNGDGGNNGHWRGRGRGRGGDGNRRDGARGRGRGWNYNA